MPKRKVTQVEFAPRLGDFGRAPTAKLRVAAYARVSTEKEEQEHSLEAQTDYFENYIKEMNTPKPMRVLPNATKSYRSVI